MATGTVEARPDRVGIYGGAFDPVHRAHIELAKTALAQFGLREVIFVPSGNPPHRALSETSQQDRMAMLNLAIENRSEFVLDDWEFRESSITYTYETLLHFCRSKNKEYFFLMGGDSLLEFTSWHRWQDILGLVNLAVAKRPGSVEQDLPREISERIVDFDTGSRARAGNIYVIDSEAMAISATTIRNEFSKGTAGAHDQLHPAVVKYIQDNGLYQNV